MKDLSQKVFLNILYALRAQFKIIEVDSSDIKSNTGVLDFNLHDGDDIYDVHIVLQKRPLK